MLFKVSRKKRKKQVRDIILNFFSWSIYIYLDTSNPLYVKTLQPFIDSVYTHQPGLRIIIYRSSFININIFLDNTLVLN